MSEQESVHHSAAEHTAHGRGGRAGRIGRVIFTIVMIVVTAGLIWLTILPAYIAAHRDPHGPSLHGVGW